MERLRVRDTDDAVSGLTSLREVLSYELRGVEKLTEGVEKLARIDKVDDLTLSVEECEKMRTALLSALISIDELFGWIRLLAEKDPEGNDLDCITQLPEVSIPIRH